MPRFVVQEHHATHLHWDFRLELEGVLKSWAVPKKPSTKEGEKRLALLVDDHDLSYIDFEGTIPEGEYGAGKVKIWDKGKFELIDRKPDKLVFELKGKRLKGVYCLIQFKKAGPKNWLFFRKKVS
ncbi:DNA polymerase ligase N-terminal domain-containing protein [Thermoproteota archaeon]